MKVYVVPALTYTRVCYWAGEIIGFSAPPRIDKAPLQLRGGVLYPGDRITKIRGPLTSAGFFPLDLARGSMEYLGTYTDLEGTVVLFDYWKDGKKVDPRNGQFAAAFYGYHLYEQDFVFCTHALAGRVVQTHTIVKEEGHGKGK